MRITFKITGVNPIYSDMKPNFVKIGKVVHSLPVMKKDASVFKLASFPMAGKSNNSIPSFIKPSLVKNKSVSKASNAHFIIVIKTKDL